MRTIEITPVKKRYLYQILVEDHSEKILEMLSEGFKISQIATKFDVASVTLNQAISIIEDRILENMTDEECHDIYLNSNSQHGDLDRKWDWHGKDYMAHKEANAIRQDFNMTKTLWKKVCLRSRKTLMEDCGIKQFTVTELLNVVLDKQMKIKEMKKVLAA